MAYAARIYIIKGRRLDRVRKFLFQLTRLLMNKNVPGYKKAIFLAVALGYWLLPDILPFIPLDDILVLLLSAWAFKNSAEKDMPSGWEYEDRDVIDVKAKVVDEEESGDIHHDSRE